jgi:GR25 family glycosyltransferase involved in LPS biosynthesis
MSHYIEKILYINLQHRKDKQEFLEKELLNVDWLSKTERFPGVYHELTSYGCSMAHLNAIKYAKSQGFKNVLILEDDFEFLVSKETVETQLESFFQTHTDADYDVLFLSYNIEQSNDTEFSFLGQVVSSTTSSGYLISSAYFDTLIHVFETNFPLLLSTGQHWIYTIDQIWKPLQQKDRWYFLKTRIGKQRAIVNDNGGTFRDYGV